MSNHQSTARQHYTASQVRRMRQMREDGYSLKTIAARFGTSTQTVFNLTRKARAA